MIRNGQLRTGRSGAIRILHKTELSIHMTNYTRAYKGVQIKSKLLHTETWSAAVRPPHRLRYGPGVFFFHRRLMALSFEQGKTLCLFPKCYSWDFSFLKLLKSGSVSTNNHIHITPTYYSSYTPICLHCYYCPSFHCEFLFILAVFPSIASPVHNTCLVVYLYVYPLDYKTDARGFKSRMRSLGFFFDLIIQAALWPCGRLSL